MPTAPPTAPEPARPAPAAEGMAVAVVEDDAACREGLALAIGSAPDMRLAWVAATHAQALARLPGAPLDVLLVDLGLPDGSGLDVIAHARRHWPACAPMVCTIFGDEAHVLAAIQAGAMGYLLKDATPETVVQEVRSLHAGGSPINPLVARKLLLHAQRGGAPAADVAEAIEAAAGDELPSLSARELEVLRLVSRGHTLAEVAQALVVSPHTARTFVRRIYAKLQVKSRADAVRVAAHQGLLDGS